MEIKSCKSCGATNLQDSATCSNCGISFADDQIRTGKSGSNKLYWILGGICVVVIFSGFLITAVAAGFFYYANMGGENDKPKETEIAKTKTTADDKSKSDFPITNTRDDTNLFPDAELRSESKKITDQAVASVLEKRGNIGEFKFILAKSQEGISSEGKKVFVFSEASAYATYLDTKDPAGKNAAALFAGYFSSPSVAKNDFDQSLRNSKKSGAKVLSSGSKNGSHIAMMNKNGARMFLTCKQKTCYLAVAPDRSSLDRFVAGLAE